MKRVVRSLRSLTPRGFTLPEVLVTVAIIAVLASAVIPSVVSQLGKGDAAALESDLSSIQTAITNFTTATRTYPFAISALNTKPATTDTSLCPGVTYGSNINNWKGPYLTGSQAATAFSATATLFKTSAYNLEVGDTLANQANHIAIQVRQADGSHTHLTIAEVSALKRALDGVDGDTTTSYNGNAGVVRYGSSGSFGGTNPVYILLVPIGAGC